MSITIRKAKQEDADLLSKICHEAFNAIADKHNFPYDFQNREQVVGLISMLLSRPDAYALTAEKDGRVVASNFLWEGNAVAGVGPITVDPEVQDSAIGRKLMEGVIKRSDDKGFLAVRLVQAAYHNRSLSLYTKLGFNTVEPLSVMQGQAANINIEGYRVREMTKEDVETADDLCRKIHGHTRHQDVLDGIFTGGGYVVEHDGRITGYTTTLGYFGHSVGESNEDIKALIGGVPEYPGLGFLLPTRNSELMRWCFDQGLKLVQPMTLMSRGIYQEPRGAFLTSVLY